MPYPRRLSNETLMLISPFIQRMEEMREGSSFLIESTPKGARQLKYQLYAWLHHRGYARGTFRLSSEGPNCIRVHKRLQAQAKLKEDPQSEASYQFMLDNLAHIKDEDQAIDIANDARKEGQLTAFQVLQALAAWRQLRDRE